MQKQLLGPVAALLILTGAGCASVSPIVKQDSQLPGMEVVTTNNESFKLRDLMGESGLIVISHRSDCPIVRRYSSEVESIRKFASSKKINVIYLNAAGTDTPQKISSYVENYKVTVPVFIDPQAQLTKGLKMQRTSEAVFLTPRYETIYQGAIDDSLDYESRREPQHHYLLDAVAAHESKMTVVTPQTEARGCLIE